MAPAWPLGDAWVTLGWPKGDPNPIPNPTVIGRGSQTSPKNERNGFPLRDLMVFIRPIIEI